MEYRREIDGLRALAILPVVFFHLESSLFTGGYAGVDVFFVISGYLITNIIYSEIKRGTFSLKVFYEKRARRILPALCLVLLTSYLFSIGWLLPAELDELSTSALSSIAFVSNFYFLTRRHRFRVFTL